MYGFLFANNGDLVSAVKTTNINKPTKKSKDETSGTQICHWSPTVAGIIML